MAKKPRVVVERTVGPFKAGGNIAAGIAKQRDPRDVLGLPQPVIPKPIAAPRSTDGLLVFDGQTLTVTLTGPIVSDGKAPVIAVQEYEGRRPKTALDVAPLGTCQVPMIVLDNAQFVHDTLMSRCAAGHVMRVYGPMIGPYPQGDVWAFASMPKVEVLPPLLPDGRLRAFRLNLELSEWDPMRGLMPQPGSRVGTDAPRKKAQQRAQAEQDRANARTTAAFLADLRG